MKRCAFYLRVSSVDQHPETQVHDLRQMAAQRGYQIIQEYTDRISAHGHTAQGSKVRAAQATVLQPMFYELLAFSRFFAPARCFSRTDRAWSA